MTASCTAGEKGEKEEPGPGVQEEGGEEVQEKQDGEGAIADGGEVEKSNLAQNLISNVDKMLVEW